MASYYGYFILCAGVALFLMVWLGKPRKSLYLIFIATMMIMAGLAFLQIIGTETPGPWQAALVGREEAFTNAILLPGASTPAFRDNFRFLYESCTTIRHYRSKAAVPVLSY